MQIEESFRMVVMLLFWSNLNLWCENPGCQLDLQAAGHFLTPFLTETIKQKSSNEADYTPNR